MKIGAHITVSFGDGLTLQHAIALAYQNFGAPADVLLQGQDQARGERESLHRLGNGPALVSGKSEAAVKPPAFGR
jgi:hypothetical protein